MSQRRIFTLGKIPRVFLIGYMAVCLMLMLWENRLIYPAPQYPREGTWDAKLFHATDVEFASADGTQLHGWYWDHPSPRAHLIYCHGNGDCVGYLGNYLGELSREHQLSIFVFDYRGYGRSAGSPAEQGILQDGRAARDWLANRAGIPPAEIVWMGRSLGGGVAVDVAAESGARGLILQNTFTSLPDVAARIYWFLPVRWLMRNQYRSVEKISHCNCPLLQSHGTADCIVPYALGAELHAAAIGSKQLYTIPNGDHNDPEPAGYSEEFAKFIAQLPQ